MQTTDNNDLRAALLRSISDLEEYIEDAMADDSIQDSYVVSLRAELATTQLQLATLDGNAASTEATTDVVQSKLTQARAAKQMAQAKFLAKDAERQYDTNFRQKRNPLYDWATEPLRSDDLKLWHQYKNDLTAANAQLILLNGVVSARFDAPLNGPFDEVFNAELASKLFGGAALKELAKLDDDVTTDPTFAARAQELTQEGKDGWDALITFVMMSDKVDVVTDLLRPLFELATMKAQGNYSKSKAEMTKISETPMMAQWKQFRTKWNRVAKHLGLDTTQDVSPKWMEDAISAAVASPGGFNFTEKWQMNIAEAKKAIGDGWDEDIMSYVDVLVNANVLTIVGGPAQVRSNLQAMEARLKQMLAPMSYKAFQGDPDPACSNAAQGGAMQWQAYVQQYRNEVNALKNNTPKPLPTKRR